MPVALTASAGLLYTRFDWFNVINNGPGYAGNQVVRSPHLTLNFGGSYTVPLANARVTWTAPGERLSASVFVQNLVNTACRSHALPGYVPATGVYGEIGDPRTFSGWLICRV
jgi:hypothetical protein